MDGVGSNVDAVHYDYSDFNYRMGVADWKFPRAFEQYETHFVDNTHHVHNSLYPNSCTVYCVTPRMSSVMEVALVNLTLMLAAVGTVLVVIIAIARKFL